MAKDLESPREFHLFLEAPKVTVVVRRSFYLSDILHFAIAFLKYFSKVALKATRVGQFEFLLLYTRVITITTLFYLQNNHICTQAQCTNIGLNC